MNILLITADQWRGECLSALGHPTVKTPHLDALAKDAVLFKQHYAQATPCAPSRTSIHTGMYMHNHRCVRNGTPVDDRLNNWAQEVRKAGYDPTLFGYTDTAKDPRGLGQNDPRLKHYSEPLPGIGSFTPYKSDVSIDWVNSLIQKGYPIPDFLWDLYGNKIDGIDWADGGDVPLPLAIKTEDHETHFMVDKCIDWINGQRSPWITHLSLLRPHPPFVAPEPYNRLYDPATVASPKSVSRDARETQQHPFLEACLNSPGHRAPQGEKTLQQARANYYGLMTEVDDNIGRLIEQLKSNGQWDSTLIIFTSDHGEQMGDHGLSGKLGYFDESYHIPLIIRDPRPAADASRGAQIDAFSENVDLMPTLLDWLNLEIPSHCDGRSLLPILHSAKVPDNWRREVHWEFDFRDLLDNVPAPLAGLTAHQCSLSVIRDHRYKYVHFTALPALFFDLEQDPNEWDNRAEDSDYQSRVLEYAQKMMSWRMHHTDRGLTEIMLGMDGPVTRHSPLV